VRKAKAKKGKRKSKSGSGGKQHHGPRPADDDVQSMEEDDCAELLREARQAILRHETTIAALLNRVGGGRRGGAHLHQTVQAAVQAALGPSYTKELHEDAVVATRRAEVTTTRLETALGDNEELCRMVRDFTLSAHGQAREDAHSTAAKNLCTVEQYHVAAILALMDGAVGGQSHWFESAAGTLAEVATGTAMRVRTVHGALKGVAGEFLDALALMDPTFGQLAQSVRSVISDGTLRDTVQWLSVAVKLFRAASTKDADGGVRGVAPPAPALSAAAHASRLRALVSDLTATQAAYEAATVEVEKLRSAYTVAVNQLRLLQSGNAQLSFSDRRALGIKYRCAKPGASSAQFIIARVVSLCTSALSRVGLDAASIFGSQAEHFAFAAGVEAHDNFMFDKVQMTLATLVRAAQGHAAAREELELKVSNLKTDTTDFAEMRECIMAMYAAAGYPLVKTPAGGAAFDATTARAHFDRVQAQAKVCVRMQERLHVVLKQCRQSEERRCRAESEVLRLQRAVGLVDAKLLQNEQGLPPAQAADYGGAPAHTAP
jgi:hypothetical protein